MNNQPISDGDEIVQRAIKLYLRTNEGAPMPGAGSDISWLDEMTGIVTLENVNGELARYRYNAVRDRLSPLPLPKE